MKTKTNYEITYKFDINASVDKTIFNAFIDKHKEILESLVNKEAYPELYGEFKTIKFVGFKIIEANKVKTDITDKDIQGINYGTMFGITQKARKAGGVSDSESKDLRTSFKSRGSMLNVPPGAVFENIKDKLYTYITGMTREWEYSTFNFTNRLVAVYKRKDGVTDDQVSNELSTLGNIWNPKSLPAVEAKEYDIIDEGIRAIDNKWIERNLSEIIERIRPQCKAVSIGEKRTSYLATVIYNDTGDNPVLPMTQEKAAYWLDKTKYKNVPGKIRYIIKSYDMVTKGQVDAVKLAKKYPKEEIRVIVQCGIITGGIDQYINRLKKFWTDWFSIYDAYQQVVFGGKPQDIQNLTLYGGVPQVTEEFDGLQVCLYKQDGDGEFTQKLEGKTITFGV